MNVTDVAILVLGSYFIIRGIFRGFSGELFSIISIFGGFYCALSFYSPIADALTKYLNISTLASTAFAMLAIFMLIFAVFTFLDKGTKKFLKGTSLSSVDKLFGAIAGFVKIYAVALLLLVAGMLFSPISGDAWVSESKTLIATAKTWPFVYPLLDRAGIIPDLAALQSEAQDYIMRQAGKRLFGTEDRDITRGLEPGGSESPPASADLTEQHEETERIKGLLPNVLPKTDEKEN